jgi:hypothetical protein
MINAQSDRLLSRRLLADIASATSDTYLGRQDTIALLKTLHFVNKTNEELFNRFWLTFAENEILSIERFKSALLLVSNLEPEQAALQLGFGV